MTPLPEKKKTEDLGLNLSPELLDLLAKFQQIEIEDFEMEVGELEIWFEPGAMPGQIVPKLKVPALQAKPVELLQASFSRPIETYPGKIAEVKLGATKGEGGTRGRSVIYRRRNLSCFLHF